MSSFVARTAPANRLVTDVMVIIGIVVSLVLIVGSVILNFRVGYRCQRRSDFASARRSKIASVLNA